MTPRTCKRDAVLHVPLMNTITATTHPSDPKALLVLAALLERLDRSAVPVDPAQYRTVADRLLQALRDAKPGDELGTLLSNHPAAAEMYENMHYELAGLCRSPLDAALAAEIQARTALQQVMRLPKSPKESSANGQS